jgi:uncharacterized protein (UPF0335 family)
MENPPSPPDETERSKEITSQNLALTSSMGTTSIPLQDFNHLIKTNVISALSDFQSGDNAPPTFSQQALSNPNSTQTNITTQSYEYVEKVGRLIEKSTSLEASIADLKGEAKHTAGEVSWLKMIIYIGYGIILALIVGAGFFSYFVKPKIDVLFQMAEDKMVADRNVDDAKKKSKENKE